MSFGGIVLLLQLGAEVCLEEKPYGEDCREKVADGHAVPNSFNAEE